MIKELNKHELADLLGITVAGLKTLERRHQLEEQLKCKSCSFISRKIVGQHGTSQVIYTVDVDDFLLQYPNTKPVIKSYRSKTKTQLDQMLIQMVGKRKNTDLAHWIVYLRLKYPNLPMKTISLAEMLYKSGIAGNDINSIDNIRRFTTRLTTSLIDHEILIMKTNPKYVRYQRHWIIEVKEKEYKKYHSRRHMMKQLLDIEAGISTGVFPQECYPNVSDDIGKLQKRCGKLAYHKINIYRINSKYKDLVQQYIDLFERTHKVDKVIDITRIYPMNSKEIEEYVRNHKDKDLIDKIKNGEDIGGEL